MTQPPYLGLSESHGSTHGGVIPELNVSVVGKTPAQGNERLERGAALALHERRLRQQPAPVPTFTRYADLPAELRDAFPVAETVWIRPAPINYTSVQVEAAIQASGLSDREIARWGRCRSG